MRIALLGDIALFGCNTKNGDWEKRFSSVKDVLSRCDYVVGNLETPLTVSNKTVGGKSAYIKGTPEDVELLKFLGISHVSLANNHMYDYRKQGLLDTIECLDKNSINWYGINNKTVELDNEALLMGFCCYSTNAVGLDRKHYFINLLKPDNMERSIILAKQKSLLPIISCHWGEEHIHYPAFDHITLSRNLAEKYDFVIHGHHPHVIQGVEKVRNSYIHYSLGNFCFDDVYTPKSKSPLIKLSQDNQESYILVLEIVNRILISHDVIPFSFAKGEYLVDNSILSKIRDWSSHLNDPKEEYIHLRSACLERYLSERKRSRDLNWYVQRMNVESAKMILRDMRNAYQYKKIFSPKSN